MASLLRRGLDYLSPTSTPAPSSPTTTIPPPEIDERENKQRSAEFVTATTSTTLFRPVDPEIDGDDCDRDCASCTIKYPAKFNVDYEDELYGHVKGWATHVLVATGKTDWVRDVADEKGSVMEAIDRGGVNASNGALKLSASNMPVPDEYHHHPEGEQPTTVLLLPGFTVIDHVTPALVPDLIRHFVDSAPTTTTPLPDAQQATVEPQQQQQPGDREASSSPATEQVASEKPTSDISEQNSALELADLQKSLLPPTSLTPLRSRPCPHAAVILLCSQKTRDARCGQSAPLLRREFERHLRPLGLYRDLHDERPGGVGIYFISHVGGHKYSANVIVYRRRDFEWFKKKGDSALEDGENGGLATNEGAAQGIWLARVRPEDCESIVKFTVLQGKVVKPGLQLRGGFDREKGLISW